jgi:pimeloyl-ACP methyl ester carboxylesterase
VATSTTGAAIAASTRTAAPPVSTPTLEEGRLVDVGGYSLFIKCTGKGSPTVVMDADLGRSASELDYVRPEVAKVTRACAYTRARLGADDPGPQPRTSGKIVDDLHKLLANAHIAGPYVLVGNGFGGFNVRLYAGRYPGEVAGMVLVDAWHEDQLKLDLATLPSPKPDEPQSLANLRSFLGHTGDASANPEGVNLAESANQVRATGQLGDMPLVVITRGRGYTYQPPEGFPLELAQRLEQSWQEQQKLLARLSSNSTHVIAKEAGDLPLEARELVAEATRQIVQAACAPKHDLPPCGKALEEHGGVCVR